VFATGPIAGGDLLVVWGGRIVSGETVDREDERFAELSLQVHDDLYLAPADGPEAADFVNHSCDPNAGFSGQIALVAMRDIGQGEEIFFDYALSESDPSYGFECRCGTDECRGRVRGDDWRRPELQSRYRGWFSPYLRERIDAGVRGHR
jgi:hypothetical protein